MLLLKDLSAKSIPITIVILLAMVVGLFACNGRSDTSKTTDVILADSTGYVFNQPIELTLNPRRSKPINSLQSLGFIQFDITQDEFPGYVHSMVVLNDTIIVCDNYKAPGIYIYNRSGELLSCYTSRGIGPDDFMRLQDLQVTPTAISAYDDAAGKIIVLDKNARLIDKYDVNPYAVSAFVGSDSCLYVDFSNFDMADMKLGIRGLREPNSSLATILEIPEYKRGIRASAPRTFQRVGNEEYTYSPAFDNVIYTLHKKEIAPRYILDFGDDWWSKDKFQEVSKGNKWPLLLKTFSIQKISNIESPTHFVVSFNKDDGYFYYLYDKNQAIGSLYRDTEGNLMSILELVDDTLYVRRTDDAIEVLKLPQLSR